MAAGEQKLRLVLDAVDRTAAPIRKLNRRIEKMTKPIRKVRNALRSLAREAGLKKLAASFGRLGRVAGRFAIAGVAAFGAVAAAVVKTSEKGDEIAKFARQIGMGASALQEYEFAAERSGVSTETFRASVGALSKRVGELQAGKGALATLLGDSDLSKQLKATNTTEEALALINKTIASIESPTKKAAFAAAAFSRAGLPMIRMANEGAEGIASLRREAVSLGNVLSGPQLAASEAFQDSLTDLKSAAGGLMKQIGANLMPILGPLVDRITDFIVANRELIQGRVGEFITTFVANVKSLYETMQRVIPPIWEFIQSIGGLKTVAIVVGVILAATLLPIIVAIGTAAVTLGGLFVAAGAAISAALGPGVLVTYAIGAAVVAVAALISKNWDSIKESISGAIDSIIAKARELYAKIPEPIRRLLGGGSIESTIAASSPLGEAAVAAASVVSGGGPSTTDVGGKIAIELLDGRARVKNAEMDNPGIEFDLAGGEALAPV